MLSQIKNAGMVGKTSVIITPASRFKAAVANVLLREGYISSVNKKSRRGKPVLEIGIAYKEDGTPKIKKIERKSKTSRRMYTGAAGIESVRQGYGDMILSTPKGVLTGDEARKKNTGGEILFTLF